MNKDEKHISCVCDSSQMHAKVVVLMLFTDNIEIRSPQSSKSVGSGHLPSHRE